MNVLALTACAEDKEGPWQHSRGKEVGARVLPALLEHEVVEIHLDYATAVGSQRLHSGLNVISFAGVKRYRISKRSPDGSLKTPTNVEIILDGTAQYIDQDDDSKRDPDSGVQGESR